MPNKIPFGAPGHNNKQTPPKKIGQPEQIRNGSIVFFPVCTLNSHPNAPGYKAHDQFFGMLLGAKRIVDPEPTREQLIALILAMGFVLVDDILELLGEETLKELTKKIKEKYEPKAEEKSKIITPPQNRLLGLDGNPLPPKPVKT